MEVSTVPSFYEQNFSSHYQLCVVLLFILIYQNGILPYEYNQSQDAELNSESFPEKIKHTNIFSWISIIIRLTVYYLIQNIKYISIPCTVKLLIMDTS